MSSPTALKAAIVVVGGGAGGVELAASLGRRLGRRHGREHVLLIDRSPLHIWKPTLHEVAAGTVDAHSEGLSYTMLARRNRFSFTLGELCNLDPSTRRLTLAEITDSQGQQVVAPREIVFDQLVLALGSGANFFGTPGAEHAYVLEHAADAERFRQRLLTGFTRAAFSVGKQLTLVIVGGGATGVELSAELLEAHAELLQSSSPMLQFALDIRIVEAAPRILSGLPERISKQAAEVLQQRGVTISTDEKVLSITEQGLRTTHGDIAADIVLWAAGIQAAAQNRALGLQLNRNNQFVVDQRLQTSVPGIYAIGDCAACDWHDGQNVPARAQAAHQQADYLCGVLANPAAATSTTRPYVYRDFGSLVSLGENRGVGNLMGSLSGKNFFVDGLIAKWMYMSLHLLHHRAILGLRATVVLALARLLQRRISGRVKLH